MTTVLPDPVQVRPEWIRTQHTTKPGRTRSVSWGFLSRLARLRGILFWLFEGGRAHERPQRLFLACCARAVSVSALPGNKLSQVHHGPPSGSGAILLSERPSLLCPFGRDEGSQEGLPAALRMGGAETNRRSPLLHATPVLLSPSQGCIPAWDDEPRRWPPHIVPSQMGIPRPPHPRGDETSCLHLNHGLIKCVPHSWPHPLIALMTGRSQSDDVEHLASLSISNLPAGDGSR